MKSNNRCIFFIKTKRHFLLIEILIAFALILLFVTPLIRNPIYFCKSQINSLEKLECERIADTVFLDIKLDIQNGLIKLNHLERRSKYAVKTPYKNYYLDLFKNKKIKSYYKLSSFQEKETPNKDLYKIIKIKLYLQPIDKKQKDSYVYKYKLLSHKPL